MAIFRFTSAVTGYSHVDTRTGLRLLQLVDFGLTRLTGLFLDFQLRFDTPSAVPVSQHYNTSSFGKPKSFTGLLIEHHRFSQIVSDNPLAGFGQDVHQLHNATRMSFLLHVPSTSTKALKLIHT